MIRTAFGLDSFLNKSTAVISSSYLTILTSAGLVRVLDSGDGPLTIVMVPDGPCVIEHFDNLVAKLSSTFRVVVFDLPGFGFSKPSPGYDHSPKSAVACIAEIFFQLNIEKAILNFTCVNGFYALAYAKAKPNDVIGIILGQTPSMSAMKSWVSINVPLVLRIPFIGQLLSYIGRFKFASRWFNVALPRSRDRGPWKEKSANNLRAGGCNCLASVIQGMQNTLDHTYLGVVVPVIALWGADDWSHRMTDPHSIRNLVPHVDIRTFAGVGHFPNIERPAALFKALEDLTGQAIT